MTTESVLREILDDETVDWPDALVTNQHADTLAACMATVLENRGLTIAGREGADTVLRTMFANCYYSLGENSLLIDGCIGISDAEQAALLKLVPDGKA